MTNTPWARHAVACALVSAPAWAAAQIQLPLQPPLFPSTHQLTVSPGIKVLPEASIIQDGVLTDVISDRSDLQTTQTLVYADKLIAEVTDDQGRTVQTLESKYEIQNAYTADLSSREILSFSYSLDSSELQGPWSLDFSVTRSGLGGMSQGGVLAIGVAPLREDPLSGEVTVDLPQLWVDGSLVLPEAFQSNTLTGEWVYSADRDTWWQDSLTHTVSMRGGDGSAPWMFSLGGISAPFNEQRTWFVEAPVFSYEYRTVVDGVAAVPEPGAWGFMLVGLAALAWRAQKRCAGRG